MGNFCVQAEKILTLKTFLIFFFMSFEKLVSQMCAKKKTSQVVLRVADQLKTLYAGFVWFAKLSAAERQLLAEYLFNA